MTPQWRFFVKGTTIYNGRKVSLYFVAILLTVLMLVKYVPFILMNLVEFFYG